ncbi:hypothetical protein [Pseudomonas sp. W4I3]|uniref:oxidoreductase n=1 Tax=Pseudomonas sp. W4I3 TaxID=3042294 RepID=UPI00277D648E|nr:hypothetical protein [Pseudomonas sp. W4I3]MDQ0741233.1 hypothetical protein [Pseudomonas sp. W4I3]
MATLFEPLRLGAMTLPNRIIMAPMTRARGTQNHVPTPIMVDYYAQRATYSPHFGIHNLGLFRFLLHEYPSPRGIFLLCECESHTVI